MSARPAWRCAVCGSTLRIDHPFPWRCPQATSIDRHHVLHLTDTGVRRIPRTTADTSPFVTYDGLLGWSAFAETQGVGGAQRAELVDELDRAVATVAGTGFRPTPFGRCDRLSDELGFSSAGGVWVKDETVGVAGSHKARHLATILLHLLAAERSGHLQSRPPLAIASCGNAALAAAVLARAADWPIDVFVPTWMSDAVGRELSELGARIHRCERRAGDPPGDPAMASFRDAVADGAIPFTVQGTENAVCLDGGRTIGWEIASSLAEHGRTGLLRVFAQVGGGAFAACLGRGLLEAGRAVRLHPVQTQGCAPLVRAWERAPSGVDLAGLGARWSALMTPWPGPASAADGILDDETYDWLAVLDVVRRGDGSPVVVSETLVGEAHRRARAAGFDVSPTGSAGLAGLLAARADIDDDECVVVAMTGVSR